MDNSSESAGGALNPAGCGPGATVLQGLARPTLAINGEVIVANFTQISHMLGLFAPHRAI